MTKMKRRKTVRINDEIPFDILRLILSFLIPKELESCRLVCKFWNKFIKSEYNYFYRQLFKKYPNFVNEDTRANWKKLFIYKMKGKLSQTYVSRYECIGTYKIHDNGGRPFKFVHSRGGIITIFKRERSKTLKDENGYQKRIYVTPIYKCDNFMGYWVGYDESYNFRGNTILIKLNKNTFVWVGQFIYQFEIEDDEIIDYVSPVGGSDVPYAIALGKNYLYFLRREQKVRREDFKGEVTYKDGHDIYRDFFAIRKEPKFKKTDIKNVKLIHERLYGSSTNNSKFQNTAVLTNTVEKKDT